MSLAYVICTSPRSGSTLLCQGLTNTGRAGAPAEFFDHREEVIAYWMQRFKISTRSEFADKIVEATSTPNGVFGTKLHATTYGDMHRAFCDNLRSKVADVQHRSLTELLHAKFSTVRYIWLRRRNKVAQGISHFRAARSDLWQIPKGYRCETSNAGDAVEFDFRVVEHFITCSYEYDRQWDNHFTRHGLTPLRLFYEDFVASYDPTLRRVLDFLDVPHSALPEAAPPLERMADMKSVEWEKKYRELEAEAFAQRRKGKQAWSTYTEQLC
jgi:LPS sulfotransferase NodH